MQSSPEGSIRKLTQLFSTSNQVGVADPIQILVKQAYELFEAEYVIGFQVNPLTGMIIGQPIAYSDTDRSDGLPSINGSTSWKEFGLSGNQDSSHLITFTHDQYQHPMTVLQVSGPVPESILVEGFKNWVTPIVVHDWSTYRHNELARLVALINESLDNEEHLFSILTAHVNTIIDASDFFMLGVQPLQKQHLRLFALEKGTSIFKIVPEDGVTSWAMREQKDVFISDAQQEQPPVTPIHIEETEDTPPQSYIFVPLIFRGVTLGIFSIQHPRPGTYNQEDLQIMQLLGQHLAIALSNMRLFTNLSTLNDFGNWVNKRVDTAATYLQKVTAQIHKATESALVILYPFNDDEEGFEYPPRIGGSLLHPEYAPRGGLQPNDMVLLTLNAKEGCFARDSADLYIKLGGKPEERIGEFHIREEIVSVAAIPLRVGTERLGALFISYRDRAHRFDALERIFINGLATYTAIAIRNARALARIENKNNLKFRLLQNVDLEKDDLQETLEAILDAAVSYNSKTAEASLSLYDRARQRLVVQATYGTNEDKRHGFIIPLDKPSIIRRAFYKKSPQNVADVELDEDYLLVSAQVKSELDVPILDRDRVIGVINLESYELNAYSNQHVDFILALAERARRTLLYARSLDLLKHSIELQTQIIEQLTDPQQTFNRLIDKALEITGAQRGSLLLHEKQADGREFLRRIATHRVPGEKQYTLQPIDQGIVGYVASEKKAVRIDDVKASEWEGIYHDVFAGTQSELAVPMKSGNNQVFGVINVESTALRNFTVEDEDMLTSYASLGMIAIQNSQSYEKGNYFLEILNALRRIDRTIIQQSETPDEAVRILIEEAIEIFGAHKADLYLYDYNCYKTKIFSVWFTTNTLEWVQNGEPRDGDENSFPAPIRRGIIDYVMESRKPYAVWYNITKDPHFRKTAGFDSRSEMAAPLMSQDNEKVIGVINIESLDEGAFNEEKLETLERFAYQAVIAIENAQKTYELRQQTERLTLLTTINQKLSSVETVDEIYDIMLDTLKTQPEYKKITLRTYDEDKELLVTDLPRSLYPKDDPPIDLQLGQGLTGAAALQRELIVVHDRKNPKKVKEVLSTDPEIASLIAVPLCVDKESPLFGTLTISHDKRYFFTEHDERLLSNIAQAAAQALERVQVSQERSEETERLGRYSVMASLWTSSSDLAHRLANDLGLVSSHANFIRATLAKNNVDPALFQFDLDKIVHNVGRTLELSNKLKEQARLQEEHDVPGPQSVQEMFEAVVKDITASVPNNVSILIEVDSNVIDVCVPRDRVQRALYNIISNACEALEEVGGGRIVLSAHNESKSKYTVLSITDNGPGIKPEIQDKIFNMYFTTKKGDAGNRVGTGYGLFATISDIVAARGHLLLDKEYGPPGARFIIKLPRVPCL